MKSIVSLLTILLLAGCASMDSQIKEARSQTKEHFRDTADLHDDALETVATITTLDGIQLKSGLLGVVWNDYFLRAFIDKKSGKVTYQLYLAMRYQDKGWRNFNRVNYDTPEGVKSESATIISRDVDCANSQYTGCKFEEHLAILLTEKDVRELASTYNPARPTALMFKASSQSGVEFQDGVLAAEAAGLLLKVDQYRAELGFTTK
jgi:hypothetical protein